MIRFPSLEGFEFFQLDNHLEPLPPPPPPVSLLTQAICLPFKKPSTTGRRFKIPFEGDTSKAQSVSLAIVSDTHNYIHRVEIPPADILIHAGDFTNRGTDKEITAFNEVMKSLPHKVKIVIPGNHEKYPSRLRPLLPDCVLLEGNYLFQVILIQR